MNLTSILKAHKEDIENRLYLNDNNLTHGDISQLEISLKSSLTNLIKELEINKIKDGSEVDSSLYSMRHPKHKERREGYNQAIDELNERIKRVLS